MKSQGSLSDNLSQLNDQNITSRDISINLNNNSLRPLCPQNNQAASICLNPNCKTISKQCSKCLNPNCKTISKQCSKISQNETKFNNKVQTNKIQMKRNPFICSNNQCKSCFNTTNQQKDYKQQTNKYKNISKINGVHYKCFVGDYKSLLTCIQQKIKQCQPLKQTINQIFYHFIDYLSQLRDKYINSLYYYGLSNNQQKFIQSFQNHQYQSLTSSLCFSIVKQLDHQLALNSIITKNKLQEYWVKQQPKIKKSFIFIDKIISKQFNQSIVKQQINSKIVIQQKEKYNLIQMLQTQQNKTIDSLQLLYRATSNDFNTDLFHSKCDLIPDTVTILQTQHGYKIGGYTPLSWDKAGNNRTDKDPSNKTFIFSLTNNHKLTLKQNHQGAILQYSSAGPTFGTGPSDIYIKNKANTVNMYGNVGNSFINQQYQFNDQKSWTKFSGATSGKQFRDKQWQVFQVNWEQRQ